MSVTKSSKPSVEQEELAPWKGEDVEAPAAEPERAEVVQAESSLAAIAPPSGYTEDDDPGDELVIVNKAAQSGYTDRPQFRQDELFIPRLRCANGLTAEVQAGEAKPGQWLLMGYPPEARVEIVIFAMARRRELRDDESRAILCKSEDQEHGEGEYGPGSDKNPSGLCDDCPMAAWIPQGNGKKSKSPACVPIYSYQAYSLTHGSPVMIDFKRTSMNEAKKINSRMASSGARNFVTTLSSLSATGPRGSYFMPQVNTRAITPEEQASAMQAFGM